MERKFSPQLVLVISLVFILSGCWRFGLDELHEAKLNGNPFQNALAKAYQKFSEDEASQYDWMDAHYFARKGLKLAKGEDVEPEKVEDWDIPETMHASMNDARQLLLRAVDKDLKHNDPEAAAKAYYLFDCWIEELEENWQTEHIDACRNKFFNTIDSLSSHSGKLVSGVANDNELEPLNFEKIERKEKEGEKEKSFLSIFNLSDEEDFGPVKSSYVIFFDFDSTQINNSGQEIIEKVIKDLSDIPEYLVRLNGYTDKVGNTKYNQKLSDLRTKVVKKTLVEKGVVADSIQVKAFGETEPRVNTREGQLEPSNRVVEIFIH